MPKLYASYKNEQIIVEFQTGSSLKSILDQTRLRVRSACRGYGACGLCKIRVNTQEVNQLSASESMHLSKEEISNNIRLACQVYPKKDMEVEIINIAPKSKWRSSTLAKGNSIYKKPYSNKIYSHIKEPLGVAIDLGTTNISITLFCLKTNSIIAERLIFNPQNIYGTDVIARLLAAAESKETAEKLRNITVQIIEEGLKDISSREVIILENIVKVGIVGNTAMLAIFNNKNQKNLLKPEKWDKYINVIRKDQKELIKTWEINKKAEILIIKPIAGFVGSDIAAGIVSCGMMDKNEPSVIVDFGTNSEIALWNGENLYVTSAAGGPAFEGMGLKFGMPASAGALYKVDHIDNKWDFKTVENEDITGICGPGYIDIIALLLNEEILDSKGVFKGDDQFWQLPFVKKELIITKNDIDLIQRAKAAIITGIQILCDKADIEISSLKIYIAGAFGYYLNGKNAKMIGILPDIDDDKIEIIGNSALNGCKDILQYKDARKSLKKTTDNIKIINMSMEDSFSLYFFENLFLKPIKETKIND